MIQHVDTLKTLAIGAPVHGRDGFGGRLRKLVVDPARKEIRALIVDRGPTHHPVVVPIGLVADTDGNHIALTIDTHELAALQHFAEIDYTEPDPAWEARFGHAAHEPHYDVVRDSVPFEVGYTQRFGSGLVQHHVHAGIPDQLAPIGRGTKVSCENGQVGHLDQVLIDPMGHMLQALLVRTGHVHSRLVRVPGEWVAWISEEEIHLSIDHSLAKNLPDYQLGDY